MALGQRLQLSLEDGTEVVATYDGRDVRAWEGKTGKTALGVKISLSMLTWWGWSAAKRSGELNGSFDKFEDFDAVCVAVAGLPLEDEPDQDPSQPGPDTQTEVSGD